MLRFRWIGLSGCVLAICALAVGAQQEDDLKAVLKKAIAAHGGEKLHKYGAATSKFKGTIEIMGEGRALTGENTLQKPDKLKTEVKVDINGMEINVLVVFDGKKLWRSINGTTTEVTDEKAVAEVRDGLQAEGAGSLVDFLKAPYELHSLGEVKIKDKPAIGIRVSKKGQRDISFFFDKKTNLVVKTEMRVYDAEAGQEVTQEKFIVAYRDANGLKTAGRIVIHKDGKQFMDLEILELKTYEKLDDSNFKMP